MRSLEFRWLKRVSATLGKTAGVGLAFGVVMLFALAASAGGEDEEVDEVGERANRSAATVTEDVTQDEPVPSLCLAETAQQMAKRIQDRYDGIRDIHSNFEQRNESASFAGQPMMTPEPKKGRVVFAKPGKMRWTYLTPEASEVVSNGSILWIHDVEGQSITRLEVTAGFLSGAALQFLLGDGQILESFDVVAAECQSDRVRLALHPKVEATYERLGLVADRKTGQLIATSVLDLFGNLTEISFSETRVNLDPSDALFEMEIPEGVELIDYANDAADGL